MKEERGEGQRDAHEFFWKRLEATSLELFLDVSFLSFLLLSDLSNVIVEALTRFFSSWPMVISAYTVLLSSVMQIFSLPLDLYKEYILERRYGLYEKGLGPWVRRYVKRCLLAFFLVLFMVEVVYLFLHLYPQGWWWRTWLLLAGVSLVFTALAPVLLVPMFYRRTPLQDEELRQRLLGLAQKVKGGVKDIYEVDMSKHTRAANAALMGFGRTEQIVLSDTLREHFTAEEIEMVLAHELGHKAMGHLFKGWVVHSLFLMVIFSFTQHTLRAGGAWLGIEEVENGALLPLLMLSLLLFGLMSMPFLNFFSRRMEEGADAFSLELVPNPRAMVSMFHKLGEQNLAYLEPHPVVEWLFYSHPSLCRRIKEAEKALQRG